MYLFNNKYDRMINPKNKKWIFKGPKELYFVTKIILIFILQKNKKIKFERERRKSTYLKSGGLEGHSGTYLSKG